MNLLFIGGAGFIGASIIHTIFREVTSDAAFCVLTPETSNVSNIIGTNITIYRGNVSDLGLISFIIDKERITKVVHLVSTLIPGSTYEDYKKEFENVVFPTVRLAQLCSKKEVQLVFFSSGGTVYGERLSLTPFKETDVREPISYYGLTKKILEDSILFEHRVSGLKYLILRPSNAYGPGQRLDGKQGLIATAIKRMQDGESLTVWGDGQSVRDYIYIDDLSHIVAELLINNVENKIINISSGIGHSINDVIKTVGEVTGKELSVTYTPKRENDVSNMILDNSLLKSLVAYEFTPLEIGISKFNNYLANSKHEK